MATAVVTGGAGFLGSHLCEALLSRGYRVICVDNLQSSALTNIEHLRDDGFEFRYHDVIEPIQIDGPVDYVFHLAALASPIDYLRQPLHSLKTGSYGTHNALGLAKWKRARFLLASTSEIYGDPLVHPQPETYWGNVNPVGPRGVYDEAKRYAEAMTMAYHSAQGVDTSIVRIFNTYGPRMRSHDGRAIPNFMRQALDGAPMTIYGDGSQTRSFCYVDDLIRGLVLLAESGEHLPVNLGNPGEFTHPRARADGHPRHQFAQRDRLRGAARRRPPDPPAGHHPREAGARLGARDPPRGRPTEDARLPARKLSRCVSGLILLAAALVAAGFTAGQVSASSKLQLGIFDDPQVLGRPDQTFPLLTQLRVQVIRVTLHWGGTIGVAGDKRPTDATDPADPAYNWSPYDRAVEDADDAGIKVLFSIVDTPRWANGDRGSTARRRR